MSIAQLLALLKELREHEAWVRKDDDHYCFGHEEEIARAIRYLEVADAVATALDKKMNMTLPQILQITLQPIATWLRVKRLRAIRASALRHMDVAAAKATNELAIVSHYQDVEMHARIALRRMGEEL